MRAFVAIEIKREIQDNLGALIRALSPATVKVKWTDPHQIHLTLKFFESLLPIQQAPLTKVLGDISKASAPLLLDVRGAGFFASGDRIRVLWCGVEESTGKLASLQKSIEDRLIPLGFPRENRPFKAHLTLGRLREPSREPQLVQALKEKVGFSAGSFRADKLVLFSSTLTPAGPVYSVLSQWKLGGVH